MVRSTQPPAPGLDWSPTAKSELAGRLRVVKPFDPYHSPLCTCPPKLTLNIYTGCGMECFYCYTSTYSRGRWGRNSRQWGPRKDLLEGLCRDLPILDELGLPVVVSLSSDPYPDTPLVREEDLGLTRRCLELLAPRVPLMLQTKSDLVLRDLDILDPARTLIGLTITTSSDALAARMEPHAPPPSRRLAAIARAAAAGFPTLCRIDPLVPGVNDDAASLDELACRLREAGARQVVSSTFKKRWDSDRRFAERFPEQAAASAPLYESRLVQGYRYLNAEVRRNMMERLRRIAHARGLLFSCCREGFPDLNDCCCDGRSPAAGA